MNAVENIESLIKKYFDESVCIKDKSISNNCISALVIENDYTEFKQNFERRLERLAKKITDSVQRKEVIEKIKILQKRQDTNGLVLILS